MLHHADIFAKQLAWTESLSNNIFAKLDVDHPHPFNLPSLSPLLENDMFVLRERGVGEDGEERESVSYYQDSMGRLPLSPVDTELLTLQ